MIDLRPTEEQVRLVDGVATVLRERFPTHRFARRSRREVEDHWPLLAELGWLGLGLSATAGGSGMDIADQALVHREFGRFLVPVSVLATNLAATIAAGQDPALAGRLASGAARCALGVPFGEARMAPDGVDGSFHVVDPDAASLVLLLDGESAALVERDALSLTSVDALDETVGLARAVRRGIRPRVSMRSPETTAAARLLMTAQLVGLAEAAALRAAEYAKTREQFGKPIGAFQAVAHLCADNAVRAEAAYCQLVFAAVALRDVRADAAFQLDAAQLVAREAAVSNASDNIQVHGGMGFSAECDAHHFLKRALLFRQLAAGLSDPANGLLAAESPHARIAHA